MAVKWESNYRGFDVYFSTENDAYNAKPTETLKALYPEVFPIAARNTDELFPVIDAMLEPYENETSDKHEAWELNKL